MNDMHLARKKGIFHKSDFAMQLIWISKDSRPKHGNYVLIHFMNHHGLFGCDYLPCHNMSELNDIKSKILNNGFEIDWKEFNSAMEWLR